MALEIERKFLVRDDSWKAGAAGVAYRQGYLSTDKLRTVRVRTAGDSAYLTIKGASRGIARAEYEYAIPPADANEMLDTLCQKPLIEKCRYRVPHAGLVWEIDEFFGDNAGLVVAEVELADERQTFELPPWAGEEVSGDARYFNASLIAHPYRCW
jgi:CYTH domain-containing protein